jgi:hypothetical protein
MSGQRNFAPAREHFRIVEAWFAGQKTAGRAVFRQRAEVAVEILP